MFTDILNGYSTSLYSFYLNRVTEKSYIAAYGTAFGRGNNSILYGTITQNALGGIINFTTALADEYAPSLSPDGARLAFCADIGGDGEHELWGASSSGGVATKIAGTYAGSPSWIDNNTLVFTRATGSTYGEGYYEGDIVRVNRDGTGWTSLTGSSVVAGRCAFPCAYTAVSPPAVTITLTTPTNNATFNAPASVPLTASVTANGHTISEVRYYRNGTTQVGSSASGPAYSAIWSSVPAGSYSLTAVAFHESGSVTSAPPVSITVLTPPAVTITLTTPTNNATFNAPASIPLTASVTANGHTISEVRYYRNGTTQVGSSVSGPAYSATWSGVPAGGYSLTAVAFYESGSVTSAPPVSITVLTPPALTITLQPEGQTVNVGSNVSFSVTAAGTPPISYQWRHSGTNLINGGRITGVTSNILSLAAVQTNDAGSYQVVVTNVAGSITSQVAVLTVQSGPAVRPFLRMARHSSGAFQLRVEGESASRYVLDTSTNLLNWAPLSEVALNSWCLLDDLLPAWRTQPRTFFRARYDRNQTNGSPSITTPPQSQTVSSGMDASFSVTATGTAPLSYQWRHQDTNLLNGGRISGATSNLLSLTGIQTNDAGTYQVVVANLAGAVTSAPVTLTVTVTVTPTLAEALDSAGLVWTTGGYASWIGQTACAHDEIDAAVSGAISDDEQTWLETTVTGPGLLRFWFKVSSEQDYDFLLLGVDGYVVSAWSGELDWQSYSWWISAGLHTICWEYLKDQSDWGGLDRVWLDQVLFSPGP